MKLIKQKEVFSADAFLTFAMPPEIGPHNAYFDKEAKKIRANVATLEKQFKKVEKEANKRAKRIRWTKAEEVKEIEDLFNLLCHTSESLDQILWQKQMVQLSTLFFVDTMDLLKRIETRRTDAEIAVKNLQTAFNEKTQNKQKNQNMER